MAEIETLTGWAPAGAATIVGTSVGALNAARLAPPGAARPVDRAQLDALTRLNRAHGVGQVMITHSLKDLDALPDPADRAKAAGFVERAGMLALGGLPHAELDSVRRVVDLTEAEARLVTSWSSPPSLAARRTAPPGVGHFLLKVGSRPGVPFVLRLTDAEIAAAVHDTNQRWAGTS